MGTSLQLFKQHLDIIKSQNFKIVRNIPENNREIAICLDDGWKGIWDTKDFLIANDIYPTIFISPSLIGKDAYLSWQQIKTLAKLGFNFQSHTNSHTILTQEDDANLDFELQESKRILSKELNTEIDAICYPCGLYSSKILEKSREAGYTKFFISVPGSITDVKGILHRNLVQDSSPSRFKAIIHGGLEVLAHITQRRHYK